MIWLSQAQGSEGFIYIVKAANNYARQKNKSPFTELVASLKKDKWDVDLVAVALQLINFLLVKCPSDKKMATLLARLENIGLYDELRSLSTIKDHKLLLAQL